ncbi:MAG TPA: hypothetical protein VMF61_10890 [Candidatus Acidoferrales bacterium]|nr:hypothetical protein [Candidatus Acidoferrales bacterium]
MPLVSVLIAAGAFAVAGAAARDGATIVNSGSTNALGYTIDVWSNGSAVVTLRDRTGTALGTPKPFSLPDAVASRFMADLKAARAAKPPASACMKSASFGTTTHVEWHGWTSPDLDCPPRNAPTAALVHDVGVIRLASGADTATPPRRSPLPPQR